MLKGFETWHGYMHALSRALHKPRHESILQGERKHSVPEKVKFQDEERSCCLLM